MKKFIIWIIIFGLFLFIVANMANAQTGTPSSIDRALRAVLIAKGQNFTIHRFEGSPLLKFPDIEYPRLMHVIDPGITIVHTSLDTGEMKWLYVSGTFAVRYARKGIYYSWRLIDLAQDDDRLYVLDWASGSMRHPDQPLAGDDPSYGLRVFWKSDGALIYKTLFQSGKNLPVAVPKENVNSGLLKLSGDGVECFGEAFRFKGPHIVDK